MARIKAASSEEIPQTFTTEFAIMAVAKDEEEAKAPVSRAPRHIRIDARRLDALMNLMGELVIARDRIAQIAERVGDEALTEATLRASQIVATLQNEIMNSRMVPVWQVFDRFPRVVRDTARSLGKEVEFKIEGKEIELDRSMLDEMGEPVLHLLRNSLDHGIETPAERKKAGKPPTATLTLTAERDRATVLIRVTDDGRGIDQAKVLPRLIESGMASTALVSHVVVSKFAWDLPLYRQPELYDIAFGFRDVPAECDGILALAASNGMSRPKAFLELACGPAHHLRELGSRGMQSIGVDINPLMLRYARELCRRELQLARSRRRRRRHLLHPHVTPPMPSNGQHLRRLPPVTRSQPGWRQ